MRKSSIRNTRVNTEVLGELSEIIRNGIRDPRIYSMVSVVSMEVTPDLEYCKAYISVLRNEDAVKATIGGLKSMEGYVRREPVRRISLRDTSELKFILDQPIEYGVDMSRLIDRVTKDLHRRGGQDEGGEEEGI